MTAPEHLSAVIEAARDFHRNAHLYLPLADSGSPYRPKSGLSAVIEAAKRLESALDRLREPWLGPKVEGWPPGWFPALQELDRLFVSVIRTPS